MSTEHIHARAQEFQEQGRHTDAAVLYKQLVEQAHDPRFFIAYGVCLQNLGHWQESAKQLRRGIELKPHYGEGDARLLLAESLHRSGRLREAIGQWRLVAAMAPEYPSYEAVPDEARRKLGEHAA